MHGRSPVAPCRFLAALCLILSAPLTGCSGPSNAASFRASESGPELRTEATTRLYMASDRNTADFYLTDIPLATLRDPTQDAQLRGVLVHIHMFVAPRAGETPIDDTACSVSIRQLVLAGDQRGLYGGGGFLLPRGTAGKPGYGGRVSNATLRLVGATPGFSDRIGPGLFNADFGADRDERVAREVGARLDEIARSLSKTGDGADPARR
jgi:hypothetical protein